MSKYNSYKHNIQDYNKSLNKIMVLGLTGMVALGASMLIIESNRTNASTINKTSETSTHSSNTKTHLKLPTLTPKTIQTHETHQ